MINIADARAGIGRAVVYRPHPGAPAEDGVITGASFGGLVFVRYGTEQTSKATRPEDLDWRRP